MLFWSQMQLICGLAIALLGTISMCAADAPWFLTYSHHMEEPGSLEISLSGLTGHPAGGGRFLNNTLELEYGATGWWTTEMYLTGQTTLTGFRWENRIRPLMREHWINPVIYVEFENLNGADKSALEVVGHDGQRDLAVDNGEARREKKHEIEAKLLLGSNFKGWSIAENFVLEKNLRNNPWEFGYAAGISRPLRLAASPQECRWCRENFRVGVEMYGGLGTRHDFGLRGTSHYVAPAVAWQLPSGATVQISTGFGITKESAGLLLRFGASYEISTFGRAARRMFAGAQR